jgi:RimK family alpha-L-glutamate ligase
VAIGVGADAPTGSPRDALDMITAIVGTPTRTNVALAYAWRECRLDTRVLWPDEAAGLLVPGDVALFRLDVLPSLDGVEPGLEIADELEGRGVRVLNRRQALVTAHDKLLTSERLAAAGVPHPAAEHVVAGSLAAGAPLPCVLKPRFGSWGQDVFLCRTRSELEATLHAVRMRGWFRQHGALLQELVGPVRSDLRIVVAGGSVVAAGTRTPATDEWRTNVTLGGLVRAASPPPSAKALALRAADALGMDLVGVDLLPVDGGWTVLELNGAVDFDLNYVVGDGDPFVAALQALRIGPRVPVHHLTLERKDDAMSKTLTGSPPRAGDEIVITGHAVGDEPRTAVILEVLGAQGHTRFHVRWEDGHESIYFPGGDAVIRRAKSTRKHAV